MSMKFKHLHQEYLELGKGQLNKCRITHQFSHKKVQKKAVL